MLAELQSEGWVSVLSWEYAGYDLQKEEAQAIRIGWAGGSFIISFDFGEMKTLGLFWLKAQFQYTKKVKWQDYLQSPETEEGIVQWAGGRRSALS